MYIALENFDKTETRCVRVFLIRIPHTFGLIVILYFHVKWSEYSTTENIVSKSYCHFYESSRACQHKGPNIGILENDFFFCIKQHGMDFKLAVHVANQ